MAWRKGGKGLFCSSKATFFPFTHIFYLIPFLPPVMHDCVKRSAPPSPPLLCPLSSVHNAEAGVTYTLQLGKMTLQFEKLFVCDTFFCLLPSLFALPFHSPRIDSPSSSSSLLSRSSFADCLFDLSSSARNLYGNRSLPSSGREWNGERPLRGRAFPRERRRPTGKERRRARALAHWRPFCTATKGEMKP